MSREKSCSGANRSKRALGQQLTLRAVSPSVSSIWVAFRFGTKSAPCPVCTIAPGSFHRPRGLLGRWCGEPRANVQIGQGGDFVPNLKATQIELTEGLTARSGH